MRIGVAIFVAGLLGIGLFIPGDALMALPKNEIARTPSYAGFAEINLTKNYFVIVSDTQSTSHWEFWQGGNKKERKLIIDEIVRCEPAFVIYLGDLTTRGSSDEHWQIFDDLHVGFCQKKIPYFPILGDHEFYGNDMKALQNYFDRFSHLDQRRWYSFTWKNVAFVMIDSNFSNLTKEQIAEQSQWYLSQLQSFEKNEKIDCIIVCCHEPPFTNSRVIKPNKNSGLFFADPFI